MFHVASAQNLGLVSKNCDNYFSDECKKILLDKDGKEVQLRVDNRVVVKDFDSETGLLKFSYRDDPKQLVGLVEPSGKVVVNPTYESIGSFSEGLAHVRIKTKKSGFIDKTGKLAFRSSFFEDSEVAERPRGTNYFSEGLALVAIQVGYSLRSSSPVIKYGFIDKTGKLVVGDTAKPLIRLGGLSEKPRFDDAKNFSEGLAPVSLKRKWGYINKDNEIVIDLQFEDANRFSEGVASVKKDGKYGFIDKSGNFVISPRFDGAGDFSEGLASFSTGSSSPIWGYVDKSGTVKIKPQFSRQPQKFSDGMAIIFYPGTGFGYIDKVGRVVIMPQFGGVGSFRGGLASVFTKGGKGFIKKDGTYLWDPRP